MYIIDHYEGAIHI